MRYRTRVTAPMAALGAAVPLRAREAGAGAETAGDPVFPALGNGGYRVAAYDLEMDYDAVTRLVTAAATLTMDTTQELSRFSLDSLGLEIGSVQVDGRPAEFRQGGPGGEKLRITPPAPLRPRTRLTVRIGYRADPRAALPHTGWVPAPDGFAVAAQPQSAHTVFPCDDHPSAKAYFTVRISVPHGLIGVANGTLVSARRSTEGRTTYVYRPREPIATELVQISVGDYTVRTRQGPHGLVLRDVVPTARAAELEPALALTPGLVSWLEQRLGPYPFEVHGLMPCNSDDPDAFQFTGLETQTLTLYKPAFLRGPERSVAPHMMHELTHSWFGNSVSPATWSDLWLNEGHADYYGLLYRYERGWADGLGLTTMDARMRDTYSRGDQWRYDSGPVAAPGAAGLFDDQRYLGGALVLYALRELVGEAVFRSIERTFVTRLRNGVAGTRDYIAVASEAAGRDLSGFLNDWLYGARTPRMPGHPDWTVAPAVTGTSGTTTANGPHSRRRRRHHDASATLG